MYLDSAYLDHPRPRSWINPERSDGTRVSQIKNQGVPPARSHCSDLSVLLGMAVLTKRKYLHPDLGCNLQGRPPTGNGKPPQQIFQVRRVDDIMTAKLFANQR